jgi:anti-sigma factor RsiW
MTDLTCRQVADFLMAYLDHDLDADVRAAFDAHLYECDECVLYLRSYVDAVRLGRDAYRDPDAAAVEVMPEKLVRAVLAARKR